MNQFEYIVKIEELERAKYKKQYDAIMREMHVAAKELDAHQWGTYLNPDINADNYQSFKLLYKVYAKAINSISDTNYTANFLIDGFYNFERAMVSHFINFGTYYMYLDAFEYSTNIQTPSLNLIDKFHKIATIIGDNKYPYKFDFSTYTTSQYSGVVSNMENRILYDVEPMSYGFDAILQLECQYEPVLTAGNRLSVYDEVLEMYYSSPSDRNSNTDANITTLEAELNGMLRALARIKEETNGRLSVQIAAAEHTNEDNEEGARALSA